MSELDNTSHSVIPRRMLYIPFIDNNGNKSQSFKQFMVWLAGKKIKFDKE